jgi:hypothetical protein
VPIIRRHLPRRQALDLLGFINELEQPARTYLYGRRMYEAMLYWETAHTTVQPRLFQEFTGIWQAAEKIVFSKTLASVSSARNGSNRPSSPAWSGS